MKQIVSAARCLVRCAGENALLEVGALRYHAYRSVDAIPESEVGLFRDEYDDLPHCQTYVLRSGTRPIGSIRVCRKLPGETGKLPALGIWPGIVEEVLPSCEPVIEVNRFVTDPAMERGLARIAGILFRAVIMEAITNRASWLLAPVRRDHVWFYEQILEMSVIAEARRYHGIATEMLLMGVHFPSRWPSVAARFPAMRLDAHEISSFHRDGYHAC